MKTKIANLSMGRAVGTPAVATIFLTAFWWRFRNEIPSWWMISVMAIIIVNGTHLVWLIFKHRYAQEKMK